MVSQALSDESQGRDDQTRPAPFLHTDEFKKAFPYYLSIGMTAHQYWNEDCTLVKDYREAERLRAERKNQELWLQGMYIYEAFCDASPLFHDFVKKGTKAHPYSKEPYQIFRTDDNKPKQQEAERDRYKRNLAKMEAMKTAINLRFERKKNEQKGVNNNADNN